MLATIQALSSSALMNIDLTPAQTRIIQAKLQTGKYRSSEENLDLALWLVDEYERSDGEWVNQVRAKIDAAMTASEQTPSLDGKAFVNQVLERSARSRARIGS